ncbi:hypothetical protein EMCRGX_G008883 [Ephydatia muelleri]
MVEFWVTSDTSASRKRLAAALECISQNVKAQEVRELGRKRSVLVNGVFFTPPPTLSPSAAAPPPQSWAPHTTNNAPPPPFQVLGEDHCTQLFQMTRKASGQWRAIGMQQGFKTDKLDALVRETGYHGDESYYAAMLRKWLD